MTNKEHAEQQNSETPTYGFGLNDAPPFPPGPDGSMLWSMPFLRDFLNTQANPEQRPEAEPFDPWWFVVTAMLILLGPPAKANPEASYWHGAYDALKELLNAPEDKP